MSNQSKDGSQSVDKLLKYKTEIIVAFVVICTGFFGAGAYLSDLWNKTDNSNHSIQEIKEAQDKRINEMRENQEKYFNDIKEDIKELKNDLKETQRELRELEKFVYKNKNNNE